MKFTHTPARSSVKCESSIFTSIPLTAELMARTIWNHLELCGTIWTHQELSGTWDSKFWSKPQCTLIPAMRSFFLFLHYLISLPRHVIVCVCACEREIKLCHMCIKYCIYILSNNCCILCFNNEFLFQQRCIVGKEQHRISATHDGKLYVGGINQSLCVRGTLDNAEYLMSSWAGVSRVHTPFIMTIFPHLFITFIVRCRRSFRLLHDLY